MRRTQRYILWGGWAAGIFGMLGAYAVVDASFSAPPTAISTCVICTEADRVFPWRLVVLNALPWLCVAAGATLVVRFRTHQWLRFAGESCLMLGVTAAFFGWINFPELLAALYASRPSGPSVTMYGTGERLASALVLAAQTLAFVVALVFIVDEVSHRADEPAAEGTLEGEGHG